MAGFENRGTNQIANISNLGFISKSLKRLSRLGMRFDDQVIKNSMAVGVKEKKSGVFDINPTAQTDEDIWNAFASMTMSDSTLRDNIAFFDQGYDHKREELRRFSLNDEIEEILDVLTDECIIYDKNKFACSVAYNGNIKENIKDEITSVFNKVYYYYGFADGHTLWDYFRKWLIDGFLAFEIIYDKKEGKDKNIIGFKELDPITLKPSIVKDENGNTSKVYVQVPLDGSAQRVLYDSQIIYISYSQLLTRSRVSYVERLIRSFNLLRIMEHTRIIWAVTNSSYKMKFVIPVGGKSKTRAKQSLAQLMHNYSEDVAFNQESGELKINGKPTLPFNRQFWFPEKDGETPQAEVIGGEGPEISDTEALRYFVNKLRDASKIPYNRFDAENPTGYELAAEGMMRDEIRFSKFIARLRSKFKDILFKPIYNQMIIKHPELANDEGFKLNLSISFNKENVFEEMKEYELMQRRIDIITTLKDSLVEQDADLNDIPLFDLRFLVDKILVERYLQLTPEDMEQNEKYKEIADLVKEGYSRADAEKIVAGEDKKKFKKKKSEGDDLGDDLGGF
jgi:hypothetical protein